MTTIGIKELLDAGVHFGHQTKRWNPKMKPFIFEARNGIHIIDLSKSLVQLQTACAFLHKTVSKGGKVLFVGTKKQAQEAVREAAKASDQYHVTERWLGGTLTNFNTIKKSIARLKQLEKMEADGSINDYGKQEQAVYRREKERLIKYLDGLRGTVEKFPAAMFIIDVKREHNAIAEARRLKIPIIAVVDTNCNPDLIDYPIAGNDDAIRSIRLLINTVMQTVVAAKGEYDANYSRRKSVSDAPADKDAAPAPAPAAVVEAPAAAV